MLLKNLNKIEINFLKMKIKGSVLLIFIALSATAQVPGYMGKRFSIGYSNYFMLSGIGPTANASSASGNIGVNTTHCFNIEYTIKRRTNFCLSLQSSNTGMDPGTINVQSFDPITSNNNNYTYTYSEHPYKPMQLHSINVGLGFKFFQTGTLAPIGKYKKLELLLMFNHLTYRSSAFTSFDSGVATNTIVGTGDYQFTTFAITYTIGRSRVLFDRIVLDYGIRFGVVPAEAISFVNSEGDFSSGSLDTETGFKYDVNTRLFRSQIFNFHIGLGFLAF